MCGGYSVLLLLFCFVQLRSTHCQTACLENEAVQLVGGASERQGRVEICVSNQWGTICDEQWSNEDAEVVCRQLGLPTRGAVAVSGSNFNRGAAVSIWLNNVRCTGSEAKLLRCPSSQRGLDSCTHTNDAGVICPSESGCEYGDVRIRDGDLLSGRVEFCFNNLWGTICDTAWSDNDATVVCRQLGHSAENARAVHSDQTPDGVGSIWLTNVRCIGTESRLVYCPSSPPGVQDCNHDGDVGVICQPSTTVCSDGDVRLSQGREGRVEVCKQSVWGTVCDTSGQWDMEDATVVCRQLGFSTLGAQALGFMSSFGTSVGEIWMENVRCVGLETSLFQCPFTFLVSPNCTHLMDVGVRCQPQGSCTEGSLRLADGRTPNEGRVEICIDNEWGTLCDDSWGTPDAAVVCLQLGLPSSAAIAIPRAGFGSASNTVPIQLDNIHCTGAETRLLNCQHSPLGSHNCGHDEDAGVICQASSSTSAFPKGALRLIGGSTSREGRVEVFQNKQWGTICGLLWDDADARVVCRQLGIPSASGMALSTAEFGAGLGPIWLSSLQCVGFENSISECVSISGIDDSRCDHSADAGVRCPDDDALQAPRNLRVTLSPRDCSRVTITWDEPADVRNVTGYSVNLTTSSTSELLFVTTNSMELTSLLCCTGYSYSVSSQAAVQSLPSSDYTAPLAFRTLPDISEQIPAVVSVVNDTALRIHWRSLASYEQQGLTAYQVIVESECFTAVQSTQQLQTFNIPADGPLEIIASNLQPLVPYRVSLNATVCDSSIRTFSELVYTQTMVPIPPSIQSVNRISPTSAIVHFQVSSSEENSDYFEISYYNYSSSTFKPDLLIATFQTASHTYRIDNLEPCLEYWSRVVGVKCGARVNSDPKVIDLRGRTDFKFIIELPDKEFCEQWIAKGQVNSDVKREVASQFTKCNIKVPCMGSNGLACSSNHTNAEYRATFVTFGNSSSEEQASCLHDWVANSGFVRVQGQNLSTLLSVPKAQSDGNNLSYVWVLLSIMVTGVLIALALVVLATVVRKRIHKDKVDSTHELEEADTAPFKVNTMMEDSHDHDDCNNIESEIVKDISHSESSSSISSRKFQMDKSYPIDFGAPEY